MRYLIVNKAQGPRGVRTVDKGVRVLLPGHRLTAEVADEHLNWLEAAGVVLEPVEDEPQEAPQAGNSDLAAVEPELIAEAADDAPAAPDAAEKPVHPLDHDENGRKGGSKPGQRRKAR